MWREEENQKVFLKEVEIKVFEDLQNVFIFCSAAILVFLEFWSSGGVREHDGTNEAAEIRSLIFSTLWNNVW